ncbi:MAG: iron uptake protein [Rhodocyclaceae bacterium]|nr:iron uptake protein [Rhodocyclaceae bacterium]
MAAAIVGGYACAWGFTALGVAGLVALGMAYHEAEAAAHMLAFLLFLAAFLWAFVAAGLVRVWLTLGGGALLMTAAAEALQRSLLA